MVDMKQFLKRQKKPIADENHQLGYHVDESNVDNSGHTEIGITETSPMESSKEVSEPGTASVGDPDIISEYGESSEIGQPPVNPDSRISALPAQIAPFEVPTRQFPLSSGFPYHRQLFHFRVSPDEWSRFTDDVIRVCSLSTLARWAVWGTGVAVGVTSSAFLTVLAIPPGYYAGKAVYNKAMTRKVRQGLKEEGELEAIMKFWNETVFMEKGCRVRLELPLSKKDKDSAKDNTSDNVGTEETKEQEQDPASEEKDGDKKKKKKEAKTEKFFKLIVEPLVEDNLSGPLILSPELDRIKEAALREVNDRSTNRSTISSMPPYSPREPPAYAPGTFVQELEANSPATAVESSARSIREMPATTKTMND